MTTHVLTQGMLVPGTARCIPARYGPSSCPSSTIVAMVLTLRVASVLKCRCDASSFSSSSLARLDVALVCDEGKWLHVSLANQVGPCSTPCTLSLQLQPYTLNTEPYNPTTLDTEPENPRTRYPESSANNYLHVQWYWLGVQASLSTCTPVLTWRVGQYRA
eukprot:71904-Rhodomonas_salina.3